jgi:hypothetical protein
MLQYRSLLLPWNPSGIRWPIPDAIFLVMVPDEGTGRSTLWGSFLPPLI